MAYWIHLVMLIVQSFTNADGVFYVSEVKVSSNRAASVCNLATPDIHFGEDRNTVSLDGTDLEIAENEPVWSGYVQTYAAFLYEGCCEEEFANSPANYTNMFMDPGECYSKCKTDVIGIQTTTCHCNPRPVEAKARADGCNSICSNPGGTVCGGNREVSIYRKVKGSVGGAATKDGHCRAFDWQDDGQHFYAWRQCGNKYPFLCDIDLTSSTEVVYRKKWIQWKTAVGLCLQENVKPAVELSFGYPGFNYSNSQRFWIGQMRSHVIGNDEDSNYQTPGWRRGVITKAGGEYVLEFNTHPSMLKSLCENETKNDDPQFPMIAVYAGVPAVLVIVAVVVIVVICKRRRNVRGKEEARVEYRGTDPGRDGTIDTGALYQNTVVVMEEGSAEGHGTKLVEKGMPQGRGTDPCKDSTIDTGALYQNTGVVNAEGSAEGHGTKLVEKGMPQGRGTEPGSGSSNHGDAMYQNTSVGKAIYGENPQNDYQELNPKGETSQTHAYLTIGNAAQFSGSPHQEYENLNPNDETSTTHEYSTIGNDAQLGGSSKQEYEDLNPNDETSPTHEYSTIGNDAQCGESPQQEYEDLNPNADTHEYSTIGNEASSK